MERSNYAKTTLVPAIVASMLLFGSVGVASACGSCGQGHHVRHVQGHGHGHGYVHGGHRYHRLGHGCGLFRGGCGNNYANRWVVKTCPVNRCCGFNWFRTCNTCL